MRFDERSEPMVEEIHHKIVSCIRCRLAATRLNAVPGEGPQHANLMLIGEAPGATEDETGRPFVGRAGQLLDDLLERSGFKREDIFITSVIKCRPPDNRKPKQDEINACIPYTLIQIDSICPTVMVTMGNVAYDIFAETFYLPKKSIGEVRGKAFKLHSTGAKVLIPTYHPAGLIYNRKLIPLFLEDLKKVHSQLRLVR